MGRIWKLKSNYSEVKGLQLMAQTRQRSRASILLQKTEGGDLHQINTRYSQNWKWLSEWLAGIPRGKVHVNAEKRLETVGFWLRDCSKDERAC
jgi:hypothetical protein